MVNDGWHIIKGYTVYVEDGYILRGVKRSYTGLGEVTTYPYWYDNKHGFWTGVTKVKVDTFRKGKYEMR